MNAMQTERSVAAKRGAQRHQFCRHMLQHLGYVVHEVRAEELLSEHKFLGDEYDRLYGESGWKKFLADLRRNNHDG